MKSGWMAAVMMIGAVSMVGCVSQSKYEEAMVDAESAKSELALPARKRMRWSNKSGRSRISI